VPRDAVALEIGVSAEVNVTAEHAGANRNFMDGE
jgi:hypothetical protein